MACLDVHEIKNEYYYFTTGLIEVGARRSGETCLLSHEHPDDLNSLGRKKSSFHIPFLSRMTSGIMIPMNTHSSTHMTNSQLIWLTIFGIAMGLLEAIVVVYLRELYFPGGFGFPLQFIPEQMLRTEILRELATIVMLVALAVTAARTFVLRFAVFLLVFGVWDVFYYVFLKVLLDWPQSLFTWDVLFLIPVTWLAPILAPLICALTMIGLAVLLIALDKQYGSVRIGRMSWIFMAAGAGVIISTFIGDYAGIVIKGGFVPDLACLAGNSAFQRAVASFVPTHFDWWLFSAGEALIILSGVVVDVRTVNT
jgi:hypothetical protein